MIIYVKTIDWEDIVDLRISEVDKDITPRFMMRDFTKIGRLAVGI